MDSVLVVSASEKGITFFTSFLQAHDYTQITTVRSGGAARRLLSQKDFALVVINAPLRDESGEELAVLAADTYLSGVVLIVKAEMADDVSAKVEDYGVFVLARPLSRQMFSLSLKMLAAARRKLLGLKNENVRLQRKIEDIRLVDRAKCLLIQYLNFTEPQAHRYIEKQAMDRRVTKRDVAEGILQEYEYGKNSSE